MSKLAWGFLKNQDITAKFLRSLTKSNVKKVSKIHNNRHEVPGMIGCLDCMHVPWENCPSLLRGQHIGKEGMPTLVVEVSCYYNLFFWHYDFGHAGALNDLNIWERSARHKFFFGWNYCKNGF